MSKRYPYIERDESWMYFNRRLLDQASRPELPLLERFNFLGIYSNNLDEFFRVRVASLRRMLELSSNTTEFNPKVVRKTLKTIDQLYKEYSVYFEKILGELWEELSKHNIHLVSEQELTSKQGELVLEYYRNKLSGSLTPIFPNSRSFIPEKHLQEVLYLAIQLIRIDGGEEIALIQIPTKEFGRFVTLPSQGKESYLMFLDDVIRYCLPYIFVGREYASYSAYTFKFTKDSELDIDTDLRQSVLEKVRQSVKRRKLGLPVRLVYDAQMPPQVLTQLLALAEFGTNETRVGGGRYHDMKDLISIPHFGLKGQTYPLQPPLQHRELSTAYSMIEKILSQDQGLHFPYHNFDQVLRLLQEAAISPLVTEIRISLYRVAKNSKVVQTLLAAAQNGKRITAVVEILARFDEESNISWSKKLQDSGVNVVIGHEQLKIHSKIIHISTVRGDIACIGSGNLHEGNAKVYTDYMLLTAHRAITTDVLKVFDFIERPFTPVHFSELLVSPNDMRRKLYQRINHEIKLAKEGKPAFIHIKLNNLVDEKMVQKLCSAAEAGVEVALCLRGCCSLVPEGKNGSYQIHINAIIDRYLEHSRIYIFGNGGNPLYYLGSTDLMTRNLDKRIEVMTPVYDPTIQQELRMIMDYGLRDNAQGYYVNSNSGNPRRLEAEKREQLFCSQTAIYNYYLDKESNPKEL